MSSADVFRLYGRNNKTILLERICILHQGLQKNIEERKLADH